MITNRCNLRCPYCFAADFLDPQQSDITDGNFYKAADFLLKDRGAVIGLIGGEPLLHPHINDYILKLAEETDVSAVMLYTNGMLLTRIAGLFRSPSAASVLRILVNSNSPDVTGHKAYEKWLEQLDLVFNRYCMGRNIKFGINLYSNDLDYSYMEDVLLRFGQKQVRFSLTVPEFGCEGSRCTSLEDFKSRKDYLFEFYHRMAEIGVLAYADCNKPPRCIWTDKEWEWICAYRRAFPNVASNIADPDVSCRPVIDITTQLTAGRCFGLSSCGEVHIGDFKNPADLRKYFEIEYDSDMYRVPSDEACKECYGRKTGHCSGGCLGYKAAYKAQTEHSSEEDTDLLKIYS